MEEHKRAITTVGSGENIRLPGDEGGGSSLKTRNKKAMNFMELQ